MAMGHKTVRVDDEVYDKLQATRRNLRDDFEQDVPGPMSLNDVMRVILELPARSNKWERSK
jgi:predicted CopG family antitoxin